MTDRVSLEEQYNNRSVIQQIYALKDEVKDTSDSVQQATDAAAEATKAANNANAKVSQYDGDIAQLKISDQENTDAIATQAVAIDAHARAISTLQTSDAKHTSDIQEIRTETTALAKELPTSLTLYRASTGKIQLQYEREDMTDLDSNVLDMIIPYQYELLPGATSRSFRLNITFSDGSKGQTNDFLIPAGGGTDVSVTGITLTKDPDDANRLKAQILLDDGTPLDSGYLDMVASVSGAFANNRLTITVNGKTSLPIAIDTQGTVYTHGNGITISGGTISVDSTVVALKTDIQDMATKTEVAATYETKTDADGTFATKTALASLQTSVGDAFNDVDYDSDTGSMTFTSLDGQQNALTLSTELVWTKMTDSDLVTPGAWHVGDQIVGGMWMFALSGSDPSIKQLEQISMVCTSADASDAVFEGSAFLHNLSSPDGQMLRTVTISADGATGYTIENVSVSLGSPVTSGTPAGSKLGYKSTQARVVGDKTASTISAAADLIAKARIGDTIVAPTVETTQATITEVPIHIATTSGNVQTGSTIYINCLEMAVISRTDTQLIANGYGRYSFTTAAGAKSETTIQQIRIGSDGSVDVLVAGTWQMSKTSGNMSKFSMLLIS